MGRRAAVVVSALAVALAVPTGAQAARGFTYGVSAAEVSSSSAILWAHANSAGRYSLQIARDSRFRHVLAAATPTARSSGDNTLQVTVRGLKPGTRFFYRFQGTGGKRSDTGTFWPITLTALAPMPARAGGQTLQPMESNTTALEALRASGRAGLLTVELKPTQTGRRSRPAQRVGAGRL